MKPKKMTYELARQLKDAGFPQKGSWEDHEGLRYWSTYDGGASEKHPEIINADEANFGFMENLYYIPTLDELIEACGEGFGELAYYGNNKWGATPMSFKSEKEKDYVDGKTPTEAVANLWLKLQEKPQEND